jgi:F0F1-type ATP synthase assembly protein I
MKKGTRALLIVVVTTATVLTPLILGGVLLGLYVGGATGYSPSVMAITFSTVGFVVGMFAIFRVIRMVVGNAEAPRS